MMKKLLAMLLCLLLIGGAALADAGVGVVYFGDSKAYNTMDGNGELSGFNVELIRAIAEMDEKIEIDNEDLVSYDPAVLFSASMICDTNIILPLSRTWDAETFDDYNYSPKPYLSYAVAIVVPADSGIATLADLSGKRVAFIGDAADGLEAYNAAHPDAPLDCEIAEMPEGYYNPMEMVEMEMADAAVHIEITARTIVEASEGRYALVEIPDADQLRRFDMWLGFNADYGTVAFDGKEAVKAKIDPLIARVEADLDALVADGTYAALCEKYFGVDLTPLYAFGEAQPVATEEEAAPAEETAEEAAEEDAPAGAEAAVTVYTDKDTVKKVQQALNDAGYPCGTPDGLAGKKTNKAVIDFKADHGIDDASADITDALLAALGIG